ncbi:MAG TPA: hypothetical protein VG817_04255, partial [Gemmatimonadales bacterium]|nr:hypothetical protein [Gemmatimonadales bacterium]
MSHELSTPTESASSALGGGARSAPVGGITAAMAVYGLAYLVWERAGWGSEELRALVGTAAFVPLNLLTGLLLFLASRNPILDRSVRRALRLFAIGSLTVLLGNTVSLYQMTVLQTNPPVSWADVFYLADSALMLAAILSFPLARRIRSEQWKVVLDAAMVLTGGAVAIWFFNVRPSWAAGDNRLDVTVLAFAYPLANLLVMLGCTTVLLRGPLDPNRLAFRLLVWGTLASIVADLTFNLVLLETGGRSAAWVDGVYLLFYLLLTASGELYLRRPEPYAPRPVNAPSPPNMSILPYVAVASTYGLLLLATLDTWIDPISGIALGAVVMTVLVVIRQVLAVRQNVRLLAEAAARATEARFRTLVQNSSDVILIVQPNGTISFVSPSVSR